MNDVNDSFIKSSDAVNAWLEHYAVKFGIYKMASLKSSSFLELGRILDHYDGTLKARLFSYVDGIMFFFHDSPLTLQNTPLFKIDGA